MKKSLCCFLVLVFCSTICFAVPSQPTDKSSFREGLPENSPIKGLPYAVPRASDLSAPLPTNKWFNSVILPYHKQGLYDLQDSLKMYTYPQVFKCDSGVVYYSGTWFKKYSRGLMISYPKVQYNDSDNITYGYDETAYKYLNNIKVVGYNSIKDNDFIPYSAKLNSYSDFSATIKWEYKDKWMKATIGQGFVFSYFEYDEYTYPALEYPYSWDTDSGNVYLYKSDGTDIINKKTLNTDKSDRFIYETRFPDGRSVFYGIFVPKGTNFKQISTADKFKRIFLVLPSGQKYFSVGLLPAKTKEEAVEDLDLYYKYAYNFVTDTKVDWKVNDDYSTQTDFNLTVTKKRTDIEGQQDGTLFCLFPHQYGNSISQINFINGKIFDTLRGSLKLAGGTKFSTKTNFYGIVPFFKYNITEIKKQLLEYLNKDKNIDLSQENHLLNNPYRAGKVIAKYANMLPVADNINASDIKKDLKTKVRKMLEDWFTYSAGEQNRYFAYDSTWGGLLGVKDDEFGSHLYNDHHFHFGYFIYASAILAMYDDTFVKDYGQMVNLLIKDFANTDRKDKNFPYMRNYDFYSSQSWANGMGGQDDRGIDQESSSEAMNTWSAVYLWGLITQNKELENLGIYLYSNEYQAIKYYYFDMDKNILKGEYKHNSIGILWGGKLVYDLHFIPKYPQTIKGIQVLPMTPAMTYLAYNKDYIREFYNASLSERDSEPKVWYDIWARLVSLYDPATALSKFNTYKADEPDEGSSRSFSYHFINFFNKCGTPVFTYKSDTSSYMVLEKGKVMTYCAYNPSDIKKNIHFYNLSGEDLGYISVGAKSFSMSSKLIKHDENNVQVEKSDKKYPTKTVQDKK